MENGVFVQIQVNFHLIFIATPKPQRGDIFIETEKLKIQSSSVATYIESNRRLKIIRLKTLLIFNFESFNRIKYIAPSELWIFCLLVYYKYDTPLGLNLWLNSYFVIVFQS